MLLLDDDDELPQDPKPGEVTLASDLGPDGLKSIDAALATNARSVWLKVARVVHDALMAGGFSISEAVVDLHVRRVAKLVQKGVLEAQGNLRRPRFSEIRVPISSPRAAHPPGIEP
jgi:hypothetical protein